MLSLFMLFQIFTLSQSLSSCAPNVSPQTLRAIIQVESGGNPFAIGVVGGRLTRQPTSLEEALLTANQLEKDGYTFSLGLAQINKNNLKRMGVSVEAAFEVCTNLSLAETILSSCYQRANRQTKDPQKALTDALSCYNSGNFKTGYRKPKSGGLSYVEKVLLASTNKHRHRTFTVPAPSLPFPSPIGMPRSFSQKPPVSRQAAKPAALPPSSILLPKGRCTPSLLSTCTQEGAGTKPKQTSAETNTHKASLPAAVVF